MPQAFRVWPVTAVFVSIFVSQCGCSHSAASRGETPAAGSNAAPINVPVVRVSRRDIASRTVLTAEFQPFQEVDVMAKVAGYVRAITRRPGRPRHGRPGAWRSSKFPR